MTWPVSSPARFLGTALLLALTAGQAMAAANPAEKLRQFLARAGSLKADFTQVQVDAEGNPGKKSTGVFYLQRPGKFRWDYLKPHSQEIISSGGKVWFYDKDLEQVTVKKLDKAIGSTPALLLTGEIPIERDFTIESQSEDEDISVIKLVPKSEESGFQYLQIGLEKGSLAGMELSNSFGQVTRIYFGNVRLGAKNDPALFAFKPPPGVDVFEDR